MSLDRQTAMSLNRRTLELLEEGRARIAQGWCQGVYARNSRGEAVSPISAEAQSWCAIGAGLHPALLAWEIRRALKALLPPDAPSLSDWNDQPERTRRDVLAIYDRAIADMRAKLEEGANG